MFDISEINFCFKPGQLSFSAHLNLSYTNLHFYILKITNPYKKILIFSFQQVQPFSTRANLSWPSNFYISIFQYLYLSFIFHILVNFMFYIFKIRFPPRVQPSQPPTKSLSTFKLLYFYISISSISFLRISYFS